MKYPGIFVVGAPRSGTSMVAGTAAHPDFHIGETIVPPDDYNKKGYFESKKINKINEKVMASIALEFPSVIKNNEGRVAKIMRSLFFPFLTIVGYRVFSCMTLYVSKKCKRSYGGGEIKRLIKNHSFIRIPNFATLCRAGKDSSQSQK
jgi:hypothetical protein